MQINATQIRVGMVLVIDNELYKVTWTMHRTPGKGNACMQTKLKNIINGRNLEKRFLSSERVERAELDTINMQYLYGDQKDHVFMDVENYEQVTINDSLIGDQVDFLTAETIYPVTFYEGNPVGIEFPVSVELKVSLAPPEIKKATASASLRPITLENGMIVQAPAFIKEGDTVKISVSTKEYIERVS